MNWESNIGHPCDMLSYNNKWWVIYWNNRQLSRYGGKRRNELSCIPRKLRDGLFCKFSGKSKYSFTCRRCVSLSRTRTERLIERRTGKKSAERERKPRDAK